MLLVQPKQNLEVSIKQGHVSDIHKFI